MTSASGVGQSITLPEGLTREYLLHHGVCPLGRDAEGRVRLATSANSALDDALEDLAPLYASQIVPEVVSLGEIERLIERLTAHVSQDAVDAIELAPGELGATDLHTTDVRDLANQPPVVRYVNLLVRDAYDAGASDIHLEANAHGLVARLRIDGVLTGATGPAPELAHAVVSRIKLLAELDIAERRRPQDGRIRVRLESRELDLRVSTVPTIFGESVVLRLLDRGGRPVSLAELGMPEDVFAGVSRVSARSHGMLLVTGPTGSGKTTTLYSALAERHTATEKIITVEDPVEYELPGITQVPVHRQAGVTFATALRSILRQDPDVIMLGEMRDPETAEVAVQAAMTGHLVFSTLHTNDAMAAVPRLVDLGVPPYLLAATLEGVLAQRLVRIVCDRCRVVDRPAASLVNSLRTAAGDDVQPAESNLSAPSFARGAGCPSCRNTGFRGRVGIYEFAIVGDDLRGAVAAQAPLATLRSLARESGLRTLPADGWNKAACGVTTVEEVLRVTQH